MMTVPMMAQATSSQQGNTANSITTTAPAASIEQAQAYADGVESATFDMAAKRVLDPQKTFRYAHPPVKKGEDKAAYQAAFSAGYQAHVKQATGQPGQ
jgi:hypothetical protein